MKKLTILFVSALALLAQSDSPNVTISNSAPNVAYTQILAYDTGVLTYICKALSTQPVVSTITVSTISNANPGVATATSHGFYYASGATQKILVFISGATSGWSTLNGFKILTPTSTGAFSIQTTAGVNFNTSGFGSFSGQTIVVSTRAPKLTSAVWSIQDFQSESGNPTIIDNPVKVPTGTTIQSLSGGISSYSFPCSAPAIHQ